MSSELISILVFDVIIVAIPTILYYYPPKEINAIYGYRTKRSSKNIESWKFSQKYFSKLWMLVSPIIILTQILLFVFGGIDMGKEPPVIPIISMSEFLIGSVICIYSTEYALKKLEV